MLIRKNTKIFKSIQEIIEKCKDRPDRQKLIRLYITKAGHSIKERINVEGIEGDVPFYYNLTYDAVWNNLMSPGRQLHQSDEIPGLYFFNTSLNKAWDETPFEFDEAIKNEFTGLPDMPVLRRKGKVEKFALPISKDKTKPADKKKEKETKAPEPVVKVKTPPQPNYHLVNKIEFSDLDRAIFSAPPLTKKGVLDYYSKIAELILPNLKDRPLGIRGLSRGRDREISIITELPEYVSVPEWIDSSKGLILCHDKDHLMWYVEAGAVEFTSALSNLTSPDFADYSLLVIESHDSNLDKALEVAVAARQILAGLQLPSFIKTDGRSALHIYIPLEPNTKFESGKAVSEYVCRLIRLKVPGLVTLEGSNDNSYGLVALKYRVNERGARLVAPWSLVVGSAPIVAAPFPWEMAKPGLQAEGFNEETIFKFIKKAGNVPEAISGKGINATAMLKRLTANYAFLLGDTM